MANARLMRQQLPQRDAIIGLGQFRRRDPDVFIKVDRAALGEPHRRRRRERFRHAADGINRRGCGGILAAQVAITERFSPDIDAAAINADGHGRIKIICPLFHRPLARNGDCCSVVRRFNRNVRRRRSLRLWFAEHKHGCDNRANEQRQHGGDDLDDAEHDIPS